MKKKIKKIILIVVIAILIGGASWYFFQIKTIQGRIVDIVTKEPLVDVEISADNKTGKTDKEGYFSLTLFKKVKEISINVPEGYEEIKPVSVSADLVTIELTPTLLETRKRMQVATEEGNFKEVWLYLHPDDKKVWDKEEYIQKLKESLSPESIGEVEIKELKEWKHPFRNKIYQNVKQVTSREATDELDKFLTSSYWQKVNGYYHFFSRRLSSTEKERLIKEIENLKKKKEKEGAMPPIEEVMKKPLESIGKKVAWSGELIQIQEIKKETFAIAEEVPSYEVFIVLFEGSTDLLEGDMVWVEGIIETITSYKSQAGWNISAPLIRAVKMEEL